MFGLRSGSGVFGSSCLTFSCTLLASHSVYSIHHEVHHEHSRTVQGKITEEKNQFFSLSQTPPPLQNMTVDP